MPLKVMAAKLVCVVALACALGLVAGRSAHAEGRYSLGGGMSFTAGQVVTMIPGQSTPPDMSLHVQNTGDGVAHIEFTSKSPAGISINPIERAFDLKPGASKDIRFAIVVDPSAPAGNFKISIQAKQTNVDSGSDGGVKFAPAIGASFVVKVVGGSSDVTIRAVNKANNAPVAGLIVLGSPSPDGRPAPISQVSGSVLQAKVAPGDYVASFEVPGLTKETVKFSVADGQKKDIVIKVTTVSFFMTSVTANRDGDKVISANLLASVMNSLRPLAGPVKVQVNVDLDGNALETVLLQQLPILPTGTSDFRQTYVPANGWHPGTYSFHFQVVTPDYTIDGDDVKTLEIPQPFALTGALVAIAIVVALAVGMLIWRRRKRSKSITTQPDH